MKKLLFILGLIVILSLDVILLLGGGVDNFEKVEKMFGIIILFFEISIIPTAIYFFIKNLKLKKNIFTYMFGIIIVSYVVAWVLYFYGIEMPKILLYIFDVYALNLYLIFYVLNWKKLSTSQY